MVGVGVNVNNSFAAAPAELTSIATSLVDATGREHEREELLADVLTAFAADWPRLGDGSLALAGAGSRTATSPAGARVRVRAGKRTVVGKCHGIDPDGGTRASN